MDRRKALAAAAAVACTLVAGTAAVAANTGLLAGQDDNVGELTPVVAPPTAAPSTQALTLVIDSRSTPVPAADPAAPATPSDDDRTADDAANAGDDPGDDRVDDHGATEQHDEDEDDD